MISTNRYAGQPRVLVVGDLWLDRSPSSGDRLGGAAAVAIRVASAGPSASLASVIGVDAAADSIRRRLVERTVEQNLLLDDRSRTTAVALSGSPPVPSLPLADAQVERLAAGLESRLIDFDLVLCWDSGLGVCATVLLRRLIEACRDQRRPFLAAPRSRSGPLSRYRGATLLLLDRDQASAATGKGIEDAPGAEKAARKIREKLDLEACLVRALDGRAWSAVDPRFLDAPLAGDLAPDEDLARLGVFVASQENPSRWHGASTFAARDASRFEGSPRGVA